MDFVNVEEGPNGILAYSLHPGRVDTEMGLTLPDQHHSLLVVSSIDGGHSLSRLLLSVAKDTPELAADTVTFLTKEKREWLAGKYLNCTWDIDEFLAKREEIEGSDLLKVRMAVKA